MPIKPDPQSTTPIGRFEGSPSLQSQTGRGLGEIETVDIGATRAWQTGRPWEDHGTLADLVWIAHVMARSGFVHPQASTRTPLVCLGVYFQRPPKRDDIRGVPQECPCKLPISLGPRMSSGSQLSFSCHGCLGDQRPANLHRLYMNSQTSDQCSLQFFFLQVLHVFAGGPK